MANWNITYRPQTISELHLDSVREQLQTLTQAGTLPQVMIFTGPKGTGKTSAARILGALVNNEKNKKQITSIFYDKKTSKVPLTDERSKDIELQKIFTGTSYLITEMDAASNRGIDDIRLLKERAYLPPAFGLVSVYILDEAHMLTTEAFNALLKLLEEPPQHALFILATTEFHKLPETIISRARVIQFKKATNQEISNSLKRILKQESISFEEEALEIIAQKADGSFRDAVKFLQTVGEIGHITKESLQKSGVPIIDTFIDALITAIVAKDMSAVAHIFEEVRAAHVPEAYFHIELLHTLHTALLQNLAVKDGTPLVTFEVSKFLLTELAMDDLSKASPIPFLPLEMKVMEIIARAQKKTIVKTSDGSGKAKVEHQSVKKNPQSTPEIVVQPVLNNVQTDVVANTLSSYSKKADGSLLVEKWTEFVTKVADTNATLAALLRSAHPYESGDGFIKVKVYYRFHQEQLIHTKFNLIIRSCAEEMLGGAMQFDFIVEEPKSPISNVTDVVDITDLSTIATQALM